MALDTRRLALLALLACAGMARAGDSPALNDFGGVGLLQTPTARFAAEGSFGGGISSIKPYNQIQIFATPLPWFEAVFRYTDVIDRRYGPASFSGDQSYKDRSFGFKLRLVEEGEHWPALAIGIQDFGGTGVFGGEYLVLSRRWYDFDLSLGLGWGRLGEGGDLRNPLTRLADRTYAGLETPELFTAPAGAAQDPSSLGKRSQWAWLEPYCATVGCDATRQYARQLHGRQVNTRLGGDLTALYSEAKTP